MSRSPPPRHIALFFEDPVYAELVTFWHINDGLNRQEQCVFLTQNNEGEIRRRMMLRGIDVDAFEKKKLLSIHKITTASKDDRYFGNKISNSLRFLIEVGSITRKRIVSDPWARLETIGDPELNMKIEQNVQAAFYNEPCDESYRRLTHFNGSLLCSYNVINDDILNQEWLENHVSNHDALIYLPRHGTGEVRIRLPLEGYTQ